MWPSLRDFLRVSGELTGKNVRIAVMDGEFPNHPDISTNERRTSYLVRGMSDPETPPEVFQAAGMRCVPLLLLGDRVPNLRGYTRV